MKFDNVVYVRSVHNSYEGEDKVLIIVDTKDAQKQAIMAEKSLCREGYLAILVINDESSKMLYIEKEGDTYETCNECHNITTDCICKEFTCE